VIASFEVIATVHGLLLAVDWRSAASDGAKQTIPAASRTAQRQMGEKLIPRRDIDHSTMT